MAARHRAYPYLAGLGNGVHHDHNYNRLNDRPRSITDDDASGEDDKFYLRRQHVHGAASGAKQALPVGAIAQQQAKQQHGWRSASASSAYNHNFYHDSLADPSQPGTPLGPWHVAAFALLGAVILLSALFLHLLADGNATGEASGHGGNKKFAYKPKGHRRASSQRHLYKKKTDEWSDDEENEGDESDAADTELLSESVRGPGAYRRLESEDAFLRPHHQASSYYNYHPHTHHQHHPQQQSRYRKTSNAVASQQHLQPQQPYARNIYQAPSYRYPIPTSHRVPTPGAASPSPMRPTVVAMGGPMPLSPEDFSASASASAHHSQHQSINNSCSSSSHHSDFLPAISSQTAASHHSSSSHLQLSPTPPRRSSGSARRSSPVVTIQEPLPSFASSDMGGSGTNHNRTPEMAPRELLLPPPAGTPHEKSGSSNSHNHYYDKTPRVRNRGKLAMATTPQPPLLHDKDEEDDQDHNANDIEQSHSADDQAEEHGGTPAVVMPFLPNLASTGIAMEEDDQSSAVQELPLLARMESGQTPLLPPPPPPQNWPPPRPLDAPPSLRGQSAHFLEIQDSIDDSLSLDSNDPRKNIVHKRPDQLMYTDAAASLQGAVDFNELELQQVIGGGGFGQVWKAVWNGTPVAVKVLTGSAQAHSVPRAILEEFAAEINLLKGMRHPNICLYMGACLAPPNRAIITELAAHGSLWDALRLPLSPPYVPADGVTHQGWPLELAQPDPRHGVPPGGQRTVPHVAPAGTWPWVLVKKVACGSARGMNYLHNGKPPVLHRDLKSANILLDESYTPKVCDFGLSRLKAKDRSMTGNCGTVQWMAPEVLANQSYNEKADVYSYGIILWELLTRECPYEDMSAIQCALAVLNRNHRPEIPRWCPPPLQVLIRSCLKKNPDERPSFTEVLQILDGMPS